MSNAKTVAVTREAVIKAYNKTFTLAELLFELGLGEEEPKKKKKVWQWRFYDGKDFNVFNRLMTEEEASKMYAKMEKHAGPFEVDDDRN